MACQRVAKVFVLEGQVQASDGTGASGTFDDRAMSASDVLAALAPGT